MASDPNPKTKEYEWLIEARAKIQLSLLELHKLHEMAKHLEEEPDKQQLGLGLGRLVGAAFSLWRAAPLVWGYKKRNNQEEIGARGLVLNYLLRDNAINFPQDRASQDWMGGFYLNNAKDRLRSLSEENEEVLSGYDLEGLELYQHWDEICSILDSEIFNVYRKLETLDQDR